MKYIDELSDSHAEDLLNDIPREQFPGSIQELLEQQMKFVDSIRDIIQETEKNLAMVQESAKEGKIANPDEAIESIKLMQQFYEANGKLELILLDFFVAYKHLAMSETDWEFRYFARKIYTLMHETRQGLLAQMGKPFKEIEAIAEVNAYSAYKKEKKRLDKFFEENDETFKNIRNTSDAHKEASMEEQLACIEEISVEKSIWLINDYKYKLLNLVCAFVILFPSMNEHVKEIMKKL